MSNYLGLGKSGNSEFLANQNRTKEEKENPARSTEEIEKTIQTLKDRGILGENGELLLTEEQYQFARKNGYFLRGTEKVYLGRDEMIQVNMAHNREQ